MLTAERLRELMRYDQNIGIFTRAVTTSSNAKARTRAGCQKPDGYRYISIGGRTYLEHRLVILYVTGAWPKHATARINLDKSDNRCANLREATDSQNKANIGLTANNTSGVKGVVRDNRGGWRAQIQNGGIGRNRTDHQPAGDEAMRTRRATYCSFCGSHEKEVARLFDGPGLVAICNSCIEIMHGRLGEPPPPAPLSIDEPRQRREKKP